MLRHTPSPPPTAQSAVLPLAALQAALDALPAIIAVVAPDGEILAVHQAWRDFMVENGGDEAGCGVGASYLRACEAAGDQLPHEGPLVAAGLRAVLSAQQEGFTFEYPCHSPTEERWFVVRVRPFSSGALRYAVVAHENVTERKHAEIRESDLDVEVGQAVRVRTQLLQQANEELDAFAGAISHDLRAPVRHIQGFLKLLRRKLEDGRLRDDERKLLQLMDGAAFRLGHMIEELLGLARVSQRALSVQDVDLGSVVRRTWADLEPERQGREIEWVLGPLPVVRGDPDLLCRVFENLLSNALKYTSGRARARIEVGYRDEASERVVFVRDDGVGFDPKYSERLFGAFQRLHSERDFAGVGMGLANVKRIVTRHGGRVWAHSLPGQGATFHVSFPQP